jgi:predicted transposase YdaD
LCTCLLVPKKKQVDKAKEAALEIARNLKAMNMPLEQIQLATKLSLKEIEEL